MTWVRIHFLGFPSFQASFKLRRHIFFKLSSSSRDYSMKEKKLQNWFGWKDNRIWCLKEDLAWRWNGIKWRGFNKMEETVVIPEGGQIMVPVVLVRKMCMMDTWQPARSFKPKYGVVLVVADTVINHGHKQVPLRVWNISTKPVKAYNGSGAAICKPFTEICLV